MTAHKHAAMMAQYAQDAAKTDTPEDWWEFKHDTSSEWSDVKSTPGWWCLTEYRRKGRSININGFQVPEPMRESPGIKTRYWIVDLSEDGVRAETWRGDSVDNFFLKRGLCHTSKEAAELHIKALLSFTETKP